MCDVMTLMSVEETCVKCGERVGVVWWENNCNLLLFSLRDNILTAAEAVAEVTETLAQTAECKWSTG